MRLFSSVSLILRNIIGIKYFMHFLNKTLEISAYYCINSLGTFFLFRVVDANLKFSGVSEKDL